MKCPKCESVMWPIVNNGKLIRFRCANTPKDCDKIYQTRLDAVLSKFEDWDEMFWIMGTTLEGTKYKYVDGIIIIYIDKQFRFAHSDVEETDWLTYKFHSLDTVEDLLTDMEAK